MIMTKKNKLGRRRGAMMVLIVVLLPILFLLSALAINISYIQLIRTEAQIATDVSARAAGRVFARTGDADQAFGIAQQLAQRNTVGGEAFPLNFGDLEFGVAHRESLFSRYNFSSGGNANSVRITSNGFASQGVQRLFGSIGPTLTIAPIRSAISTQVELDIALIIDRSGSMAYAANEVAAYPPVPAAAPAGWDFGDPVPPQARWLDTIAAVQVFLNEMQATPHSERVSLVTYHHDPNVDLLATTDYASIANSLNNYSYAFHAGGTNIGDGIYTALWTLGHAETTRPWANKVAIVMTDGIHNTGSDPRWAAKHAAKQGVMVFSVTFSNEADHTLMLDVANKGGGSHYHASTAAQLSAAFEDIARQLPTLLTR